jgi:ribosome maturation factor RimP
MIDKQTVENIVRQLIDDNDIFVVDVTVGSNDKITVYLDKFGSGFSLSDCEQFHNKLYPELEKIYENFDLTVS